MSNGLQNLQGAVVTSSSQVWETIYAVIPTILGAMLVFAFGLFLAYWSKKLILKILTLFKITSYSRKVGIEDYLKRANISYTFSELVASCVEWLIILVFFLAFVDILGLDAVSNVVTNVLLYIPNIIAAAFIVGIGYLIANFVGGLVRGSLVPIDSDVANPIGNSARMLIIVISVFAAIDQLQIAQNLVETFFQGLTYTFVLVIGLSLGLGSKDVVSKILDDWYKKVKKNKK